MELSGKDADELRLCNILITNVLGIKKMAGGGDSGSDLSTGPCKCNSLTSSTETMIELLSLKEEVNRNTRAVNELKKQCSRDQMLTDLQDIKSSVATLQSITDSLQSVINVDESDPTRIVRRLAMPKNNASSMGENLMTSERQRTESPFVDS